MKDKVKISFGNLDLSHQRIWNNKELLACSCHNVTSIHMQSIKNLDIESEEGDVERSFTTTRLLITYKDYSNQESYVEIRLFGNTTENLEICEVESTDDVIYAPVKQGEEQ